jgi:hypothetical protein
MNNIAFGQIISRTPSWVFALLLVLVALGLSQMRDRVIPLRRVYILPVVFCALSLAGVLAAFAGSAASLVAWAMGYLVVIALVGRMPAPKGAHYISATRQFAIPGSAVPLLLMMGIFFIKYFVGASTGMGAAFTKADHFPWLVSALYGGLSGVFAGQAWQLLRGMMRWKS